MLWLNSCTIALTSLLKILLASHGPHCLYFEANEAGNSQSEKKNHNNKLTCLL